MRLNSKQIAEFTGATVVVEALDPSQLALGITWDSRDVQEDFVYVALPGARVDGHDFICLLYTSSHRAFARLLLGVPTLLPPCSHFEPFSSEN